MNNRDIIIVGLQPWDLEIGSNCKNIAIEFAKNNRVLYVNSPLDRITAIKEKNTTRISRHKEILKKNKSGIVKISDNLNLLYPGRVLESINWVKPEPVFGMLNKINNNRFAKDILRAINILGFKNYIIFNDGDMFRSLYLKELLNPSLYIYYSRDYFLAVDYWKTHGVKAEPEIMRKSDFVVSNSVYLSELASEYNPKSFYVGQGCDIDDFRNCNDAMPEDLKSIKKPVIGYVGALKSLRLDIELLEYIAERKPEWNIVLVGPEDLEFKTSKLHNCNNVFFTGPKKTSELPAFIRHFDVCINPQLVNEVTIGNYPRKIDEYLAAGKPVVATDTPAMQPFGEHVYLAKSREDYIDMISEAIDEKDERLKSKRINFASEHTWENSVKNIYKSIENINK